MKNNLPWKCHGVLNEYYFLRSPENRCINCGKKLRNINPQTKNSNMYFVHTPEDPQKLIGYCHSYNCEDDEDLENI